MKIKLITFAPHPNFGTCLQSYALNRVLRDMGHDVEFIYNGRENKPNILRNIIKRLLPQSILQLLKNCTNKSIEQVNTQDQEPYLIELPDNKILYALSKLPFYNVLSRRWICKNLQWRKVYKFTYEDCNFAMRRIYTHKQYENLSKDTDLFVTGSDQIWNPYCGGFNPMMFVEFCYDVRRIAYSSSISRPKLPKSLEARIKEDLSRFSNIAVREQKSVELLNNLLGRNDVKLVVDPTYLLDAAEWKKFGERAVLEFEKPDKYIFCYFVGDEQRDVYEQMVCDVKKMTNIENVITLDCYNRDFNYGDGRLYKDAGPYEWVHLLANASYICTDSFHATVFTLKFQKDFVHALKSASEGNNSQNTRMLDILNRYGIIYKLYSSQSEQWKQTVDYKRVTPIIESEITDSIAYLKLEVEGV